MWNLLSDTYNLVSYMMLQRTTDYAVLGVWLTVPIKISMTLPLM